jgi:hypothetical protein
MKLILAAIAACLILLVLTPSVPLASAGAPFTRVIDVGGNPESVVAYGDYLFASNLGQTRGDAADGDGYISRIDERTGELERKFLPLAGDGQLNSPMGLIVTSDVLYVNDLNRVVGFSLRTRKRVFETFVPDAQVAYLNDIAYLGEGKLLVSATNVKKLYVLDPSSKIASEVWKPLLPDYPFTLVNGLLVQDGTLYVAHNREAGLHENNGALSAFKLDGDGARHLWDLSFGRFLDGITSVGAGRLWVSDWRDLQGGGDAHVIDTWGPSGQGVYVRREHLGQRGLADFTYDSYHDVLALPAMLEGAVHVITQPFEPNRTVTCVAQGGPALGTLSIRLDERDFVRSLSLAGASCSLGYSSFSESQASDHRFYETLPRNCGLYASLKVTDFEIAQYPSRRAVTFSVTSDKEPEPCDSPNPRACDPSTHGYTQYVCRY